MKNKNKKGMLLHSNTAEVIIEGARKQQRGGDRTSRNPADNFICDFRLKCNASLLVFFILCMYYLSPSFIFNLKSQF